MEDNNNTSEQTESNSKTSEQIEYEHKIYLLVLYIKMICNNILIKTRRKVFPRELKDVVVNLVVDKFNSNTPDNEMQQIQSMTEYDRTVNFGVSSITKTKLEMMARKQLDEYDSLINEYRLLYRVNIQPKEVGGNNE